MKRFRFSTGRFAKPFRRAPGRCGERGASPRGFKETEHPEHRRGLTGTGAAREDHGGCRECRPDRLALLRREADTHLAF